MSQSQTSGHVRFQFPPRCLCCWHCQSLLYSAVLHPVHLPSTPDQVFAAGVQRSGVYLHHKTKASSSSSLFHYPHPLRQSPWCSPQVPQYDIPCHAQEMYQFHLLSSSSSSSSLSLLPEAGWPGRPRVEFTFRHMRLWIAWKQRWWNSCSRHSDHSATIAWCVSFPYHCLLCLLLLEGGHGVLMNMHNNLSTCYIYICMKARQVLIILAGDWRIYRVPHCVSAMGCKHTSCFHWITGTVRDTEQYWPLSMGNQDDYIIKKIK